MLWSWVTDDTGLLLVKSMNVKQTNISYSADFLIQIGLHLNDMLLSHKIQRTLFYYTFYVVKNYAKGLNGILVPCMDTLPRDRDFMVHSNEPHKLWNVEGVAQQSRLALAGASWCIQVHLIISEIYTLNGQEGCSKLESF